MTPIVTPYVPENITVHLGPPGSDAANVTVPFSDYIKNVASSEIYPTWDESALRANILAITSFALNRIYTEFYRSRGYSFDITSSTAYDQNFIAGRNYFSSIVNLVDELFNDYLRRPGFVEPLAAKFCNGTTVTCEGLSQWGSEYLAREGYDTDAILRNYYGSNLEIVRNAPIQGLRQSYPGEPLRLGSQGPAVGTLQISLNRIAQDYPAIPIIAEDGIFGPDTETAVRTFQRIFNLTPDGIVGPATWYAVVRTYVAVNALAELRSEGQRIFVARNFSYPGVLQRGIVGDTVQQLQYMLSVLSQFIPEIPPLAIDGTFGAATAQSVAGFQRYASLPVTETVDAATWDAIYDEFAGIEGTVYGRAIAASSSTGGAVSSAFSPDLPLTRSLS